MDYGRFHDERCWHFHFWCCLCTLLVRTVDRFLTTVSFSLIMQVGDGFWMKSYIFLFFSAFHGNERYRIGKKMLVRFSRKWNLFPRCLEELLIHVHCTCLPESFNLWVELVAVRGRVEVICRIRSWNCLFNRSDKFTFIRESHGN